MTLPDVDTLDSFGGAKQDAALVVDPRTDRAAAGTNPAYANIAMATHTLPRCIAKFTANGGSAPTLGAHDELWQTAMGVSASGPTGITNPSTGVFVLTWPVTVQDEVPGGSDGASTGHALNLRFAWVNGGGGTEGTCYLAVAEVTAPNEVTVRVYVLGSSPELANPTGVVFTVFAV